jgi:prevent-host-death family protein
LIITIRTINLTYIVRIVHLLEMEVSMTTVPFSEAREKLTEIVNEVAYTGKRIVVTRRKKKIVAIISIEDLEIIEKALKKIK